MKRYRYLMSIAGIGELRFCLHWACTFVACSSLC